LGHQRGAAQVALPALRLLGQDVALHRHAALDLAGGGHLEPLHGRAPRLELQLALLLRLPHGVSSDSSLSLARSASAGRAFLACSRGPASFSFSAFSAFLAFLAASLAFFSSTSFRGARICTMVMPSCLGELSTRATSVSSPASRTRMRRPMSLCTASRPR